jgi:hypothetical protein
MLPPSIRESAKNARYHYPRDIRDYVRRWVHRLGAHSARVFGRRACTRAEGMGPASWMRRSRRVYLWRSSDGGVVSGLLQGAKLVSLDQGGGLVLVDGAAVGVFDVVEEVWWGVG